MDRLPTPVFLGFPGGADGKKFACNEGDSGWIPVLGRSPGGGHGNPLQYSCLENPMDRGVWQALAFGCKELDTTERLNIAHYHVAQYHVGESVFKRISTFVI